MSMVVWIVVSIVALVAGVWLISWPVRTLVGLYAAPEVVGGTYLAKCLRHFGVPPVIVPPDVRTDLVRDAWMCTGFRTGRLARRAAFRDALDANALEYARWLLNPAAPLSSESEFGSQDSPLRRIFGVPLDLPPHIRDRILDRKQRGQVRFSSD